jgi:hypothetical protein
MHAYGRCSMHALCGDFRVVPVWLFLGQANHENIARLLGASLMLVTALNPHIGGRLPLLKYALRVYRAYPAGRGARV